MQRKSKTGPALATAVPGLANAPASVLVLPALLTHVQATACLHMLMQGLRVHRDRAVVVDAHALRSFDTSALAVLLECRREALAEGKSFTVHGLPAALVGMAGLYGVQDMLAPEGIAPVAPDATLVSAST